MGARARAEDCVRYEPHQHEARPAPAPASGRAPPPAPRRLRAGEPGRLVARPREPRPRRRRPDETALDLAVAVRAEEHALLRLLAEPPQGLAAAHVHLEGLLARVDVVEVQVEDAPRIAAQHAAPA